MIIRHCPTSPSVVAATPKFARNATEQEVSQMRGQAETLLGKTVYGSRQNFFVHEGGDMLADRVGFHSPDRVAVSSLLGQRGLLSYKMGRREAPPAPVQVLHRYHKSGMNDAWLEKRAAFELQDAGDRYETETAYKVVKPDEGLLWIRYSVKQGATASAKTRPGQTLDVALP